MLKRIILSGLLALAILVSIILYNTFTFKSTQDSVKSVPAPELTEQNIQHFQKALSFKTISYGNAAQWDSSQFIGFRDFLATTYPLAHATLKKEIVADYSLLYTWTGKNSELKPIVLMAHQDVVPIEEATRSMWSFDPFAGTVKDGFIWGRGTTDDKINLISILEITEKLLSEKYQPERTIYLAFGHDEEIGGKGAIAIAQLLKQRGIVAEMVLDEGGIITKEKLPGVTRPVALIGTSEKGYLSLDLTVEKPGGHSSMPEKETAIDILTKGLTSLRENPFSPDFSESTKGLMASVGPEMPFVQRMAFANPWLFKSLIIKTYEKTGPGNAMIRTTMVPTILQAGIKDNVVPTVAKATVNFRLLPGTSTDEIVASVKKIVNDDRIVISKQLTIAEPSEVTPVTSTAYLGVESAIKNAYPEIIASPFLVIGATDSRHFREVSQNIIKFSPMIDPIGFHGIDERVSLESYQTALWFFEQLIRNTK